MTDEQMDKLIKASPDYTAGLADAHKVWSAARNIIAKALRDWGMTSQPDEYAAAIISRLASHNPPILIDFMEQEK